MKMYKNRDIGKIGEQIATKYLEENKYEILKNNFYCKQGEMDIVAKDNNEIVFIEVKTRTNDKFGKPSEAVNYIKQKHLYKVAKYFLYKYNLLDMYIRFDVIEVFIINGKFYINHIKQAIIEDF